MTSDVQKIFASWYTPLGVDEFLSLAALVYLIGWLRLRGAFQDLISAWRLAAFLSGIVLVWIAIGSPLNAFDDDSLTVHMVQHLLLIAMAPPLILMSAPALPLLQGFPRWITHSLIAPSLRWSWGKRLGHFATNPAIGWLANAVVLIVWHIPAVFDLALHSRTWHEFEHVSFFGAGLLFWWPVVQPWPSVARWPRWSIPLYLFCATIPCDVLSGFLAFCDRVVYSSYLRAPQILSFSPLHDQECAAAMMWTCTTIIFLVPAVIVTVQILSPKNTSFAGRRRLAGLNRIGGQGLDSSRPGNN
jgi:cytochrome c oxidase assembly factor CtaG